MTDTTTAQPLPAIALADQLMELRELAAQLRLQAAQADQLIAQAERTLPIVPMPAGPPIKRWWA